MPKSPKGTDHKSLDSSLVINTLMNLSQRVDKTEWTLSDLKTRTTTQETEQATWKSRFHDVALVGVLGLVLLLIVSFYIWRHLDSRIDTLETGLTSLTKEVVKKDEHTELKVFLEKAKTRLELLEKLIEEKHKPPAPPVPPVNGKPKK